MLLFSETNMQKETTVAIWDIYIGWKFIIQADYILNTQKKLFILINSAFID